ncbi:hypothetical protein MSG28_008180 [Choristoneura fumiferana]|uniref:Uncharacterized protein n=1 Tax=Choristoneura fumiferana TaxID=7141 RepID=A0ACC0JAF6_CHOFU|nr:hypothetical protein MSG28_008180 [Choristoneura fumiferana]
MNMVDTEKFLEEISGRSGAGARVEGKEDLRGLPPLVEQHPAEQLGQSGKRVPLLTGVVSAETSRAVLGKYSGLLTSKLKDVQDFIKNDVIGGLRGVVSDVRGLVPNLAEQLPVGLPLADYYQTLFDSSFNAVDGLLQIAEATDIGGRQLEVSFVSCVAHIGHVYRVGPERFDLVRPRPLLGGATAANGLPLADSYFNAIHGLLQIPEAARRLSPLPTEQRVKAFDSGQLVVGNDSWCAIAKAM